MADERNLSRPAQMARLRGQAAANVLPPGSGQVVQDWLGGADLEEPVRYGATARPPVPAPAEPMYGQVPRGYMGPAMEDPNAPMTASQKIRAMEIKPNPAPRGARSLNQLLGPDPFVTQEHRLAAADLKGMANSGLDPFEWQKGVAHDPQEALAREWAGKTGGADPFAWEKGIAHDPIADAQAKNAAYWKQVQASRTPMDGGITPAFRHAAYSDPMKEMRMAGPAAEAAATAGAGAATGAAAGGRVAGAARGALGAFGGLPGLAAFGVLNNAVDLADPNSVMRKAIHEGNYGTALARGAVNFIPGGGTVWDVLSGNSHPNQPTVNQPQQEQPLDLTGLFDGNGEDPLRHGNYTSRKEAMELYKLQKTFEPKPAVEAAQNQMKMLSRDLQTAMASGDKTRIQAAYKNYNDFERLLALGQNSYPYMHYAMGPVEHDWLGGSGGY